MFNLFFLVSHLQQFFLCLNLHGFVVDMKGGIHTLSHPLFVRERSDLLQVMANSSSNNEVWNLVKEGDTKNEQWESEGNDDMMLSSGQLPYTSLPEECTTQAYTSIYHQLLWEGYSVTSALWLVERLISQRLAGLPCNSPNDLISAQGGSTRWYKEQSFSPENLSWPHKMNRSISSQKDGELSFQKALVCFNGGEEGFLSDDISTEAVYASSLPSVQRDKVATKPVKPIIRRRYRRAAADSGMEVSSLCDLDLTNAAPTAFPSLFPLVQSLASFTRSLKAIEPELSTTAKDMFDDEMMQQEGPTQRTYLFTQERQLQDKHTVPVGKRIQATIPSIVRENSRTRAAKAVESVAFTGPPSESSLEIYGLIWSPETSLTHGKSSSHQPNSTINKVSAFQTVLDVAKRRCSFMPHLTIEHGTSQSRFQRGDIVIIKTLPEDSDMNATDNCDETSTSVDDFPCKRRRKGEDTCTNDQTSSSSSSTSLEAPPTSTIIASIVDVCCDSHLFQVYTGDGETINVRGSQIVSVIDQALPPSSSSPLTEEDIWFLLYRNQGDISATICDVTSDWGDDSQRGSHIHPQRLSQWSREEVRKLCQGYRRYGDDIHTIRRQYFRTDRPQSEILSFFMILRPYLRQGLWQQICAVFSRAAQDRGA